MILLQQNKKKAKSRLRNVTLELFFFSFLGVSLTIWNGVFEKPNKIE